MNDKTSNRPFWIIVALVLLTATVGYRLFDSKESFGALRAAPETLHIGPVAPVYEHQHVLRLINDSAKPVVIDEFVSSCTCADVSPTQIVVPPNGHADITLTVDLLRYVTPGRERNILGELHVSPLVSGDLLEGWTVGLNVIRPKIIVPPYGNVDFETVYPSESSVSSANQVFVLDEIEERDLVVRTEFASANGVRLVPLGDGNPYYDRYHVELDLPTQDRPSGLHRFDVAFEGPNDLSSVVPCRIRFDSGVRVHVRIARVRWST
ncbi:MAG: hypothetical protein H8E66_01875 [Planctomycetes bacterium]|nr:hypothetical protein [Planctomycetota bacterium]